jgi:murein DD-endopeptidase MepM/ murein hydrolase activator NlpD
MLRLLQIAIIASLLLSPIFGSTSNAEAVQSSKPQNIYQSNYKDIKDIIKADAVTKNTVVKPKLINGELDFEPNVKLTKLQKQDFDKCKSEEKQRRSKRNKNKPTSCIKIPSQVNEEFTNQDYTNLIDRLQENRDISEKKNMNTELPVSDFVDVSQLEVCNSNLKNCTDEISNPSSISVSSSSSIVSANKTTASGTSSALSSQMANSSNLSSTLSIQSSSNSNSKTSFLDILLGNIKAEARTITGVGSVSYDYRLPYEKNQIVSTYLTFNDTSYGVTHNFHNALDFIAVKRNGTSALLPKISTYTSDVNIVAAMGGTVVESYDSTTSLGNHVVIKQDDGNYAVYAHLESRYKGVKSVVKRGDKIGVQGHTGAAGVGNDHLHFEILQPGIINYGDCKNGFDYGLCYNAFKINDYKVIPQFDECFVSKGGMADDEPYCSLNSNNQGYPYISQSLGKNIWWTSISAPLQDSNITDPNIKLVTPAQANYMKAMDGGCLTADNSRVYIFDRTEDNNCQKMRYNANNTITNPYGKCLDGGDVYSNASNRWVRYSTCNGGNNQKWKQDDNGRIWSLQKNNVNNTMCIEYYDMNNSSGLDMNPCNSAQGQKWWFDIGIAREAVPTSAVVTDPNIQRVQPPQADYRWAMDNRCGTAENTQVVMKNRDGGDCQKMRYNTNNTITNPFGKCLDAGDVNSASNNYLRFSSCHGGNNQKWKQDNSGRIWSLQKNNANQVLCIQYQLLADQYGITTPVCSNAQEQKWYFDIDIAREEIPTAPVPTANYKLIKSLTNGGLGFNLYGGSDANQTPIKMWSLSGTPNELFSFEASGEIKNKINNKCVDAGDVNSPTNRWLRIQDCHGGSNQKFYIGSNASLHTYANTSLCVDSATGNTQGAMIYMYTTCTNAANQQWNFN